MSLNAADGCQKSACSMSLRRFSNPECTIRLEYCGDIHSEFSCALLSSAEGFSLIVSQWFYDCFSSNIFFVLYFVPGVVGAFPVLDFCFGAWATSMFPGIDDHDF